MEHPAEKHLRERELNIGVWMALRESGSKRNLTQAWWTEQPAMAVQGGLKKSKAVH